jgi:hypothetical protein
MGMGGTVVINKDTIRVNKWNDGILNRDWCREFHGSPLPDQDCGAFELRRAGVDAASLRRGGFEATELLFAGYTASELLKAGFRQAELTKT